MSLKELELVNIGDYLRDNPDSWMNIPEPDREFLRGQLVPPPGKPFTQEQKHWIRQWWLECNVNQVKAINNKLPENVRVSGSITNRNKMVLSCDLLSDCREGERYEAARHLIESLKLVFDAQFPVVTSKP